jgi:hypothetical protein
LSIRNRQGTPDSDRGARSSFEPLGDKDLVGSSSIGNQTAPAVGRHFGSDPTRSSERYESAAASATSLNQALPGVWDNRPSPGKADHFRLGACGLVLAPRKAIALRSSDNWGEVGRAQWILSEIPHGDPNRRSESETNT